VKQKKTSVSEGSSSVAAGVSPVKELEEKYSTEQRVRLLAQLMEKHAKELRPVPTNRRYPQTVESAYDMGYLIMRGTVQLKLKHGELLVRHRAHQDEDGYDDMTWHQGILRVDQSLWAREKDKLRITKSILYCACSTVLSLMRVDST
jgi:hypothetical protein